MTRLDSKFQRSFLLKVCFCQIVDKRECFIPFSTGEDGNFINHVLEFAEFGPLKKSRNSRL